MTNPMQHADAAKSLLAIAKEHPPARAGQFYVTLVAVVAPVVGEEAVHALLARAVKMTRVDLPVLDALTIDLESTTENASRLDACLDSMDPAVADAATTAIFTQFFALLAKFIGKGVVSQLVKRATSAMSEPPLEKKP